MARSRSTQAHDKVLRAALDLFAERGIDAASMDSIAQVSGVSKATIYNHWPDKEALLMEVMVMIHGLDRGRPEIDSGDLQRDLTAVLTRRPPDQFDEVRVRMTPSLIAYSAIHPEFGKAWRHRVMDPGRECILKILRGGVQRRILPRNLDLDASVALLMGPMLYEHIFHKDSKVKPPDIGPTAAAAFCRAFLITGKPTRKNK
jgi:AcrR family transcriptional regulator